MEAIFINSFFNFVSQRKFFADLTIPEKSCYLTGLDQDPLSSIIEQARKGESDENQTGREKLSLSHAHHIGGSCSRGKTGF
jgi:hypothetical protein